jgi:hypothetical protein
MSRTLRGFLAVALALGALGIFLWSLVGTAGAVPEPQSGPGIPKTPTMAPPNLAPYPEDSIRREKDGDPSAVDISFIDSPSATCYRPIEHTNTCYIQWSYLYVTASSSQYIISMTVSISNQIRAYYSGFFQSSMYIPGDMQTPGFRVSCGEPGSGGNADLGRAYPYTIRARETGGLKSANYGTVYCPADTIRLYLPIMNHR